MHLATRALIALAFTLVGVRPAVADVSAPAPAVRGKADLEEARRHFMLGSHAYAEARYQEALQEFEAVNRIAEAGPVYFNIAHCHERLNQPAAAIAAYRQFLKDPRAPRAQIEERIEQLGGNAPPAVLVATVQAKTLDAIALDIERLKSKFPQLKEFSAAKHFARSRQTIDYSYKTHRSTSRGGWSAGVPNPDDDGIWLYINFHDVRAAAQIDTQPVMRSLCIGDQRVTYLILEGAKTPSVVAPIAQILEKHGVTACPAWPGPR